MGTILVPLLGHYDPKPPPVQAALPGGLLASRVDRATSVPKDHAKARLQPQLAARRREPPLDDCHFDW